MMQARFTDFTAGWNYEETWSFTVFPGPTNLYVSGCNGCMPTINWTVPTHPSIDHYEIWWKKMDTQYPGWQIVGTTSNTSWLDTRATITDPWQADDTYRYKVKAVSTDGLTSAFSNEDEVPVEEGSPW